MVEAYTEIPLLIRQYLDAQQELDDLRQVRIPYLTGLYQEKIGYLQVQLLEFDVALSCLRAWIAEAQRQANLGLTPDAALVEAVQSEIALKAQLAYDLAEAEKEEALRDAAGLIQVDAGQLALVKEAYRRLAFSLHPDLHPGLALRHHQLWLLVQEAYARHDLDRLLALELVYRHELIGVELDPTKESNLRQALQGFFEEIAALRQAFPLNMEAQLNNSTWVLNTQSTLLARLDERRQERDRLQAYYQSFYAPGHG